MPIVNVKRFSRDKRLASAAPAAAAAEEPPERNDVGVVVEDVDADADTDADAAADFSDLSRSAFEGRELAAAAAAEADATARAAAKEDARIEKEMAKKVADVAARAKAGKKPAAAAAPKRGAAAAAADDDSLFAAEGTEIMGKDKRVLITKCTQYRQLFPKELKGFKIKKNASVAELRAYLDEMEVVVQCSSIDDFVIDSILATLKIVEGVSSYSKNYNITGLADMLKMNPQFVSLVKQLWIKYGGFENTPPEHQLALIVITTSYICVQKNKNRSKIEAMLAEPATCPFSSAEKAEK